MHFVLSHFLTKAISCNYKPIGNTAKNGGKFSPKDSRGTKNEFGFEKGFLVVKSKEVDSASTGEIA